MLTNLQAISGSVNYPVQEVKLKKILIDRGIEESEFYTGMNQSFELATADVMVLLVSSANITEGGYQISLTDKTNLLDLANLTYTKYGEKTVATKPEIRNRSNAW
jgi:hypothetical protein